MNSFAGTDPKLGRFYRMNDLKQTRRRRTKTLRPRQKAGTTATPFFIVGRMEFLIADATEAMVFHNLLGSRV